MTHLASAEDNEFKKQVETCKFDVQDFNHRAHLRLAYIYLTQNDKDTAINNMRATLLRLLRHVGIDPSQKYHETLTKAWILAVHHFINNTEKSNSADDFIDQNPIMLDSKIMMTHYSAELLFTDNAKSKFVQPNLDPIPRYKNNN